MQFANGPRVVRFFGSICQKARNEKCSEPNKKSPGMCIPIIGSAGRSC